MPVVRLGDVKVYQAVVSNPTRSHCFDRFVRSKRMTGNKPSSARKREAILYGADLSNDEVVTLTGRVAGLRLGTG